MGWFKRNLFFATGGILALGLLGAAGFYVYQSWQRNVANLQKLTEIYNELKEANSHPPLPGNAKVDNIAAANEQRKQLDAWIRRAREYFQPIAPIPNPTNAPVSNEAFAGALHRTIDQLQRAAATASVQLPPQYMFSFVAQSDKVRFSPGSVEQLAQQLGEVKTISETLFAARVNALEGIQRVPISDDDAAGSSPSDYLTDRPVTSELGTLTPYQVTFRGFSAEIAQVLEVFAASPHGFIVKTISVMPASMTPNTGGQGTSQPYIMSSGTSTSMTAPMPARGGLQTVLNEQMLRVTLLVEVVKLSPGH